MTLPVQRVESYRSFSLPLAGTGEMCRKSLEAKSGKHQGENRQVQQISLSRNMERKRGYHKNIGLKKGHAE